MNIGSLTCNNLVNPIGIDTTPKFSWKLYSDKRNIYQTEYRITVTSNNEPVWDSGNIRSDEQLYIPCKAKLSPRTKYEWQIQSRDNNGQSAISEKAYFETGKLNEKWTGKWIAAPFTARAPGFYIAPYLRKTFKLQKAPVSARLYICGLGYFEASINSKKVGDDLLATPFTRFDARVYYRTFDVTDLLKQGGNCLGVLLGNGWYNSFAEDPWNTAQSSWRHTPKLLCELYVTYDNNDTEVIKSDNTWRCAESPIRFNGIRNGEFYDAQYEIDHWCSPELDDHDWDNVYGIRPPGGRLLAMEMEPIRITREIPPVNMRRTPDGSALFDFGQNIAGIVRLNVTGAKGTEITIKYGERVRENGEIDRDKIKGFIKSGEYQTDKYIKRTDGQELWQPRFVYHGFQYVEVSGLTCEPDLNTVTALFLHTDVKERGHFECSDNIINKVQENVRRSTLSNLHSVPTDCPHREKNAWTGDVSLSSEQTIMNLAPMAIYRKWLYDIKDAQRPDGAIPCVVPSTGWGYNWGNGPDWSSALTLVPWYLYLYCGDVSIIEDMYENIKRHCDYIHTMSQDYIANYGIGDWCAPFDGPAISKNMSTFKAPRSLTDTAYFYNTCDVLSKMAKILNHHEDEIYYRDLANRVREAFRKKFMHLPDALVAGNCQTSTACVIYQGLAEENEISVLVSHLKEKISEFDNHLDFGLLGMKYVLNTLGRYGLSDLAIEMLTQETYPGFGYSIKCGANTIWECWNGDGSRNHHMFGEVSAFFYKYLAGITYDEESPGFRVINFRPAVDTRLTYVKCTHESMYGTIECSWEKSDDSVNVFVEIPVGCKGKVTFPKNAYDITESGLAFDTDTWLYSGRYVFTFKM